MQSIVIIPTYNEHENLAPLTAAALAADLVLGILVGDGNSPDGTGALTDELARHSDRVRVLHRPGKVGLGAAYLAGFAYALDRDYTCIPEMDADFSHDSADLPQLLAPVREGRADLVLGSRWAPGGGTRGWPLHWRIIGRSGSWYARAILGMPVRDLTDGFKCFRRRALEGLDLGTVRTSGYGFQIELTYLARRGGARVLEVPIVFTQRGLGQSKMSGRIVAEALALVWRLRLDRPAPRAAGRVAR